MFNLQGSEIIFILLIALVVLGPEKLPGAIRRVTSVYAELRKMSTGFQNEFKSALDEPIREMKSTADLVKNAADPKRIAEEAEREAELDAIAERKARESKDATDAMQAAGAAHLAATATPVARDADAVSNDDDSGSDAFADPVDEPDDWADAEAEADAEAHDALDDARDDIAVSESAHSDASERGASERHDEAETAVSEDSPT